MKLEVALVSGEYTSIQAAEALADIRAEVAAGEIEQIVRVAWLRADIARQRVASARQGNRLTRGIEYEPTDTTRWLPVPHRYGSQRKAKGDIEDAVAGSVRAADFARDKHQWPAAARHYRAALDMNAYNAPILVQYGHALKEAGDVRSAEFAYRAALEIDPSNGDTHLQLGHALRVQGRTDAAVESYLRALSVERTLSYPWDELIALGWTKDEIEGVLEFFSERTQIILSSEDAARAFNSVTLMSPANWADVGPQPVVVFEITPPSSTAELIVSFSRVADITSPDQPAKPVTVARAHPHDTTGCMWVASCPMSLDRGAYIVTVARKSESAVVAVGGIHVCEWTISLPAKIISPADWAVIGSHPVVDVWSSDRRDLTIQLFGWKDFCDSGRLAKHVVSGIAQYDPALGLHRYTSAIALGDGPYAVTVWNSERRYLTEQGVVVDSYLDLRHDYNAWVERDRARVQEELPLLVEHIDYMVYKPIFVILVETYSGGSLTETIAAIERQIYRHWRVHFVHSATWADIGDLPEGEFIVPLRAGAILEETALYEFANELNANPGHDMIYADEDRISASGEYGEPFHKPAWSPDYLETFNYIGYPACFRRPEWERRLFGEGYYGFVLGFTEHAKSVFHLPKVLCHSSETSLVKKPIEKALEIRALSGRLERTGRSGDVRPLLNCPMGLEVRLTLPSTPLVSIVMPTAGKTIIHSGRSLDLVVNCIASIRQQSTYQNIEIILVDNGDISEVQQKALRKFGCQFVTYTSPIFNVAKKLNLGASHAKGEFLLLMNDDIEVITPDWIERMLEHFSKDHVGVVGVKLCYPNNTIQHAGVVHNYGNPDHVRRGVDRGDPGYFLSTAGVRNYSAVTGATMMVRRNIYQMVGGYTEVLAESFNDVDFCQKVREKGLFTTYTPHAELIHYESQSRKPRLIRDEIDYYQERWAHEVTIDPYYNESYLTVAPPTFEPVINKPLL